jgi:hypothetical protein
MIHAALEQATGIVQHYLRGQARRLKPPPLFGNQLFGNQSFNNSPLKIGAGGSQLRSQGRVRKRQFRKLRPVQVIAASVGMGFCLWNWRLLLTGGLGLGTLVYLYRLPRHAQQQLWAQVLDLSQTANQLLQQSLRAPRNSPLLLAIGGASVVALTTYLLTGQETGGSAAVMLTLQGWVILGLGGLLLGQRLQQQTAVQEQRVDEWLVNLTHHEPLQRLIAVRQLQRLRRLGQLDASQRQLLTEAFCLLLAKERQIIIRNALFDEAPAPRPRRLRRSALPAALSGQQEVQFARQKFDQKDPVEQSLAP